LTGSGPGSSQKAGGRQDGVRPAGARAHQFVGVPTLSESERKSWRDLLELDAQLFGERGIRLLTPEARLLIHLKLEGSFPVTEAMKVVGVSYRGFYAVLERLKRAGLIRQAKDTQDQRVRKLRLDSSTPLPPSSI
jgi:hypothetical protein